ncbi:PD-(D/E)XK nuclease superfamily protein [Marinitoga hydrogenitolerans DSM 16785]|uniref:PD-(D/E)XK nuclease superfamily protein n=1 Tax=Marinitoga hydrogenitolerans (strain DSM 16785 / JCM 12826 / AT1271) TaxID=1122195 RepID=A0A1M4VHR4_MARH1|nr:PD-(D/E)XK nuclease family protein [Marinitoga hydrogenitolerans]SHE68519.1 PD-(D/E)XK nuclease superfamily protein [Marinitoga hydrogenitolerans DSM 16785]
MISKYPEKSWSFSKYKTLMKCPRAYYYSKFLMWGGWERTASERSRKAYRLTKLTTIEQFLGALIHKYIANNITALKIKDIKSAINYIGKEFNKAVYSSYKLRKEWELDPKNYTMFYSVYYKNRNLFEDKLGKEIKEKTNVLLNNYFNSNTLKDLQNGIKIIEIDKEKNYPSFFIRDYKIYSIVDLMYEKNNEIYIIDWKTGKKSSDDEFQLKLYALYAYKNYNIDLNKITLINEYLYEGTFEKRKYGKNELLEVEKFIEEKITVMEEYLDDKEKNIPKSEAFFPAKTSKYNCKWCNFKEICPEYSESFINTNI